MDLCVLSIYPIQRAPDQVMKWFNLFSFIPKSIRGAHLEQEHNRKKPLDAQLHQAA